MPTERPESQGDVSPWDSQMITKEDNGFTDAIQPMLSLNRDLDVTSAGASSRFKKGTREEGKFPEMYYGTTTDQKEYISTPLPPLRSHERASLLTNAYR